MRNKMNAKFFLVVFMAVTLFPGHVFAGSTKQEIIQRLNRGYQTSNYDVFTPAQASEIQRLDSSNQNVMIPLHDSSYIIHSMKYNAELDEEVVTVKGKVDLEITKKKGESLIPLVDKNVGLIDVKVNKGKAVITTRDNRYYLVINKAGKYTLDIEYLIKAYRESKQGLGYFDLSVLPAPISQFEFTMEKGAQVFIEPAIKVDTEEKQDHVVAWAVLPHTQDIRVRWSRAIPEVEISQEELNPKVYVETTTNTAVGGGVIHSQSHLQYTILQSPVSQFRIALPTDVSILEVAGVDLRDWRSTKEENEQYLNVILNVEKKGDYHLVVTYERDIAEGSQIAEMPWIRPLDVERDNGYYGISANTNVELSLNDADRVTNIDARQLPQIISQLTNKPILLAFKYLNHPFHINIEITRHEELPVLIAAVDAAKLLSLKTEDGKILTKAVYEMRNNVKQYLRLKLPEGATIWSTFVAEKPVQPAQDKDGVILIPLQKSQVQNETLTQFPVEVVYLNKNETMKANGRLSMNVPKIDVPINEFFWSVYFPLDYAYFHFQGDLKLTPKGSSSWMNFVNYVPLVNTYVQRGLQGRFRSAADDIGVQFSPGNTSVTYTQRRDRDSVQTVSSDPNLASLTVMKGVLPIKIQVPQQGHLYQFQKLLVIEEESPSLSAFYSSTFVKVMKVFRVLIVLGLAFLILNKVFKFFAKTKKIVETNEIKALS